MIFSILKKIRTIRYLLALLTQKNTVLLRLQRSNAIKDKRIDQLKKRIADQLTVIKRLQQNKSDQQTTIIHLRRHLTRKANGISELKRSLLISRDTIATLRNSIKAKINVITSLKQKIALKEKTIQSLREHVKNKSDVLTDKVHEIDALQNEVIRSECLRCKDHLVRHSNRYDVALICGHYPRGIAAYGGQFLRTRAEAYARRGLSVLVCEVSPGNTPLSLEGNERLGCLRLSPLVFERSISSLTRRCTAFAVHEVAPHVLEILLDTIPDERLLLWMHGTFIRDYRRLHFNYTSEELELRRPHLDAFFQKKKSLAQLFLPNPQIQKIFVSNFIKRIASIDCNSDIKNFHIIPNYIHEGFYRFNPKDSDSARNILMIRSFKRRSYATDIAMEAIQQLSGRSGFGRVRFTIRGTGALFEKEVERVRHLPNVDVAQAHLNPHEMRALHLRHGVFLAPSRFDSHGVSACEAMASGLVPVSCRVAAIPEFIDESCGILVPPDSPGHFAEAIWRLQEQPEQVEVLSRMAATRVRQQCGFDNTIFRELQLLRLSLSP